jgi:hypothetical protein
MGWAQLIAMSVAAGGPIDVRRAAPTCDLTPRAVRDRARREDWWRPFRHIVAVPGTQRDGRAWARAVALHAAGQTDRPSLDLAAITRSSALAVLGIHRSFPSRVDVAIRAERVLAPHPRLLVVRSSWLTPDDVREIDGVPVVVGPALLRDLATVRDRNGLRSAAIDLAHAGFLDLRAVPGFLHEHPSFPGRPLLRQVAHDLLGAGRTDSPFELEVRERLADDGIFLDRGQVPLPGPRRIHLDLGILAIRFGIELLGFGVHARRRDLDRDAQRTNAIAMLDDDWRVLHATWSVLADGWDGFVEQVRSAIAAQSRRHLSIDWPQRSHLRG